jgi:phage shock protein E
MHDILTADRTTLMPRHQIFLLCALTLGLGSACTQAEAEGELVRSAAAPAAGDEDPFPPRPYPDRDLALAQQLVEAGALLLDVRSASEFASGHIDGAVNIPHTQISERTGEILDSQGGDPHKPIVLYCRSGHRAGLAKRDLEEAGFDRLTNFGGIDDWPDSHE